MKNFSQRHIGIDEASLPKMLETIKCESIDKLIEETVPSNIRLAKSIEVGEPMSEFEYIQHLKAVSLKNKVFKSYIGLGYYNTIVPAVIQRNIFENPGWYTQYTPYQAEIAQGRLESLLNFQTMVSDLTGLPIANASLLDEGTAAGEAMQLLHSVKNKKGNERFKIFIDNGSFPQTIDVIKGRAIPHQIELVVGDIENAELDSTYFAIFLQYPSKNGNVNDFSSIIEDAKSKDIGIVMAADLMSLALLKSPGEWDVDIAVGNTQRFGVPMGFGGPHAAYFACKEAYKRQIPGRIIGVSVDKNGNRALRMALQTREQHIKREKATSNICTAQALLANMAAMYAVYHGPEGVKAIALDIHQKAIFLAEVLSELGYNQLNKQFFDTLSIEADSSLSEKIRKEALSKEINLGYESNLIRISIDETTTTSDIELLVDVFATAKGKEWDKEVVIPFQTNVAPQLLRTTTYMEHPIFNSYHTESEMLRYIKRLENKDLSLAHSMISLGSCTMKLNATTEMVPLSWRHFSEMHPFAPSDQTIGYMEIIHELEKHLSEVTGFYASSLQPNSGAQGEYAGLMVIRAYHENRGDFHRNVSLIPRSAHGTNPASAVMAGMTVVVVDTDELGNIDVADLKSKAEQYKDTLSCLMVTYPSTHGVFEETIIEICDVIHQYGGKVYMDGANMNAQVGLTSPARIGADVCHLNLHKTFAIPHGGGGPGMGPICCTKDLAPYLPGSPVVKMGGENAIPAISAAPWGSASILLISYGYIKMLGSKGLTDSTKYAILNANYLKEKMVGHYPILYAGKNNRVAHEFIIDCRSFKDTAGVEVADIAKRLMDYGFHAPTVSFPVPGTMMIEPTESESMNELDKFADAMIAIRKEIDAIENGTYPKDNNLIVNAPHTAIEVTSDSWTFPYGRQEAAFPLPYVIENKFWPSVSKIDNAFGDRNLICTCTPIEAYA